MRNFRIKGGDLVLNSGKRIDHVEAEEKLFQDLSLWLMEPIGTGFSTPAFGSLLPGMIGVGVNSDHRALEVENEVQRILTLYQADQAEKVKDAVRNASGYIYTRREILWEIVSVISQAILDRVAITASIRTASDSEFSVLVELNPEGEGAEVATP